jgi:hypothetical protein
MIQQDQLNEIYSEARLSAGEAVSMKYYLSGEEDFYGTSAYEKLYEHFAFNTGEMPYGVAKARTETPDVWILEYLENLA